MEWTYDESTCTITFTGSGKMKDYKVAFAQKEPKPWAGKEIRHAVISEGITHIGAGTFWENALLEDVSIPSTVESVGSGAFTYCKSLTKLVLPD